MVSYNILDSYHIDHIKDLYIELGKDQKYIDSKIQQIKQKKDKKKSNLESILNDFPELKNKILIKNKNVWDFEKVKNNIVNQINEVINLFK